MYRHIVSPLATRGSGSSKNTSSTAQSHTSLLDKTPEESTLRFRNDKSQTDVVMFVYNEDDQLPIPVIALAATNSSATCQFVFKQARVYKLLGLEMKSSAPEVTYESFGVGLNQWSRWLFHDVEVELHIGVPLIVRRLGVTRTPYLEHYVRLICQSPQGGSSSSQLSRMGSATYRPRDPTTPGFTLNHLRRDSSSRSSPSSASFSSSPTSTPIRALLSSYQGEKTPRGIKREPSSPSLSTPTKRMKRRDTSSTPPSVSVKKPKALRQVTPADVIEISDDEEVSVSRPTNPVRKGYKVPKDAEVIEILD